jgi:AcrR family transcriptional regulator
MEQQKKECILVEAAKAFARFGFRKTAVDDIAKNAGVAKGTIYLAADSKEDLFFQVLHREVRAWIAEVAQVIDPRVPADELLGLASATAIQKLDGHPLVKDLLLRQTHEVIPNWYEKLEALCEMGGQNVREILSLGVKQGVFRPDLDTESLSTMLHDMQLSALLFHGRVLSSDPTALARFTRAGLDMILNGLRSPRTVAAHL